VFGVLVWPPFLGRALATDSYISVALFLAAIKECQKTSMSSRSPSVKIVRFAP